MRILALAGFCGSAAISVGPAGAEALLLVEADSGKVLHAENATYPWYPASITKLMTTYVTLRAVKEGRIKLDTLLTVSANAVAQQPSKMGFPAGTQVTIDNALKMLMVKSANDMAVVLAEGVSGSIEQFASEMNRTSAELGMVQSNWVNPNGLPAGEQITSARDMAILGRALIREFPEYDIYWHISAIKFGRRIFRNYNKLIDRYPGADGMKTGFICASGYNLVASATRNGKRLIAVVLGAPSGKQRAETAAQLFEKGFNSGALSWLIPALGGVEALRPIAATPPDLRDQICGKGRRHRTDHAEEEEQAQPAGSQPEPGSAYALTLPNVRTAGGEKVSLLGPYNPSMPPIPVSVIPVKGIKTGPDGAPEPVKVAKKKGGRKTVVIDTARQTSAPASMSTGKEAGSAKSDKQTAPAKKSAKPAKPSGTAAKQSNTVAVKPETSKPNAAPPKSAPVSAQPQTAKPKSASAAPAKKKPAAANAAASKPQP